MKEIVYKYSTLGAYTTEDDSAFGQESHMKIVVEPHDFSLAVGGETLRNTSCSGYAAIVSRTGEAVFYDTENKVIGRADADQGDYKKAILVWTPDALSIRFGYIDTVDYYPNCDGEHDRWGTEWVTERSVTLNLTDNSVEVQ